MILQCLGGGSSLDMTVEGEGMDASRASHKNPPKRQTSEPLSGLGSAGAHPRGRTPGPEGEWFLVKDCAGLERGIHRVTAGQTGESGGG